MASVTTTFTVSIQDLSFGPGRATLRLALSRDPDGNPVELTLSPGFGIGAEFNRPSWAGGVLQIPAASVPGLLRALATLAEGGEP